MQLCVPSSLRVSLSEDLPVVHEALEGCANMGRGRHMGAAKGASGGTRYGAAKRVKGAPPWGGAATGASGGTLYGATNSCIAWGKRMRTPPLELSVELAPYGARNVVLGKGDAYEHSH
eukprot:779701-Pyramimonas_sp.AAC.1